VIREGWDTAQPKDSVSYLIQPAGRSEARLPAPPRLARGANQPEAQQRKAGPSRAWWGQAQQSSKALDSRI